MEHTLSSQAVMEDEPATIQVCPVHGVVYDERGVCELCEEEERLPIWATPQNQIRAIMSTIPGGTWRYGERTEDTEK